MTATGPAEILAGRRRVLAIDQDTGDLDALRGQLTAAGYDVSASSSIADAAMQLSTNRYDLIVLDPRVDASSPRAAVERFRSVVEHAPIIVLIPDDDDELAYQCLESGAQEFVRRCDLATARLPRIVDHALARARTSELRVRLDVAERHAALGEVASYAIHEINNQIAIILASVDLSQVQLKQLSDRGDRATRASLHAVLESLDTQARAVERVAEILCQLRDFSGKRRSSGTDALGAVDVCALVDRTVRVLGNRLRHRAILSVDLSESPPALADERKLAQVILNLLNNAMDALTDRLYEDSHIRLSVRALDDRVVLTVRDTGCGIPAEYRHRLFEPFFTSKHDKGTGLGLAICADIISGFGGEISVDSEPGQGAAFHVSLPVAPDGANRGAPAPPPVTVRRRRVLLVDDDRSVRARVSQLLALYHDVVVAESGSDALDNLAADADYDAIVCDLMMPGKDGVRVWEELQARHPALAPRFAFLTGGAFTPRAQRIVDEGRITVVHKPCRLEQLLRVVEELARAG